METVVDFSSYVWLLLLLAAFASGLVDAIAGGGGLIQVPALFSAYPDAHPATLLSANKVSSIGGTINAARRYLRHAKLPWNILGPAIIAGFIGALLGALAVSVFPPEPLRKALPFISLARQPEVFFCLLLCESFTLTFCTLLRRPN